MFKHNYIQKIAFDNIRRQKKFYKFIFASLILVFALSSVTSILFSSYDEIEHQNRAKESGNWSVSSYDLTNQQIKSISSNQEVVAGKIYQVGSVYYNNNQRGNLISIDNQGEDLLNLTLLEGRFPKNNKEIVIEEEQFLLLNIQKKINQNIELTINNENIESFKIVGIVKDYSSHYPLSIGSYITIGIKTTDSLVLLDAKDHLKLWNAIIDNELDAGVQFNQSTYSNYVRKTTEADYTESEYATFLKYISLFIGFVGILGTMTSALSKRNDNFILLKSIGATNLQIQKMILYEGLFLTVIACLIGVAVGMFSSLLILLGYYYFIGETFIYVLDSTFYIQTLVAFIVAIIAIFIPSLYVRKISMSKEKKFKIIKNHSLKIRKINVFTLAFQQLSQHKIASILLSLGILLGVVSGNLMSIGIDNYYTQEKDNDPHNLFDYRVNINDNLSNDEMKQLNEATQYQSFVYENSFCEISWNGIEKEKTAQKKRNRGYDINTDITDYRELAGVTYHYNDKMIKEVLDKANFNGRYPKNDNETLLIKPYFKYNEESLRKALNKPDDLSGYVDDVGLEIGDQVSVYAEDEQGHRNDKQLQIVGTIRFDNLSIKEERLFTGEYELIVNKKTYDECRGYSSCAHVRYDCSDTKRVQELKRVVYDIKKRNQNIDFINSDANIQERKSESLGMVIRNMTFFGMIISGLLVSTYLHRKIKLLAQRREIGIFRAIGMTNKQVYLIQLIYGCIIYMVTLVMYCIIWTMILYQSNYPLSEIIDQLINPIQIIAFVILFVGFILSIILPMHGELKESVLDTIVKE